MRPEIAVIGQALNTDFATFTSLLQGQPADVLLTNVAYSDDTEMNRILAAKRSEYPEGSVFRTSMHELSRVLGNSEAETIVIDNLNLYVSNILLLHNSYAPLEDAVFEAILQDVSALIEFFLSANLSAKRIFILTAEVDFDYHIRTDVGHIYRRLLYRLNGHLINSLEAQYGVLTNGAILWIR